jgi:hypothetical protein
MSLLLVPISIAVISTVSCASQKVNEKCAEAGNSAQIKDIKTKYINADLLKKTLEEHMMNPVRRDGNTIVCSFESTQLIYHRNSESEPFLMDVVGDYDSEQLLCNIKSIETEFDGNLQTYSYNQILNNIPEDMHIENEEVAEDNSIIITLSVD